MDVGTVLANTKIFFRTESIATVSIMVEPTQLVYETLISRLSMPASLRQSSVIGIIVYIMVKV